MRHVVTPRPLDATSPSYLPSNRSSPVQPSPFSHFHLTSVLSDLIPLTGSYFKTFLFPCSASISVSFVVIFFYDIFISSLATRRFCSRSERDRCQTPGCGTPVERVSGRKLFRCADSLLPQHAVPHRPATRTTL